MNNQPLVSSCCLSAILFGLAVAPTSALALEHTSSIVFEDHRYAHQLDITGIPACPELLDTLFSMETMRRLTPFVDTLEVLEETVDNHVVRIELGVLGFHTALVYQRLLDRPARVIVLELLRQEGSLPLVSFPTSFQARYELYDSGEGLQVEYSQEATMEHRASLPHRIFVWGQMDLFERRLLSVVQEACP